MLFLLLKTALLFVSSTLIWGLYQNRASYSRDVKLFIGGGVADTMALYKSWWGIIVFHFKYFIVWCWLEYLRQSSTRRQILDFAFKFSHTNGRYYITHATQYAIIDGVKTCDNNVNDLLRIFLVLFPHTVVSYRHFLRNCKNKHIIHNAPIGEVLDIKYMTSDGIYSIKFNLENEKNLTIDDDLLFGELAIDPTLSSKKSSR